MEPALASTQLLQVLIVEDNPGDVYMTKLALKQEMNFVAAVVTDGEPAIAYLRREGEYADVSRPDFVVLDLNLQEVDGGTVLRFIRNTPELRGLLVFVLSSSPEDVMRDVAAQADCYICKPPNLD
ncbi:MAG: response regulator, partial [Bryobacteraceae bacterium]